MNTDNPADVYVVDVPALSEREYGQPVTATIRQGGFITYTVDTGDGKRDIDEEINYDGITCAHLVHQLRLVQTARKACEALMEARERVHAAYDDAAEHGEVGPLGHSVPTGFDECGRAETALAQARVEYERATAALPHSLL